MDKHRLVEAIRHAVAQQLHEAQSALAHARASAIDDEARPENQYDTRALELSYLAAGQAERVADLQKALTGWHFYEPVEVTDGVVVAGALVELAAAEGPDRRKSLIYLAPFGFGLTVELEGQPVQVVTGRSPVGGALLEREAGEIVPVEIAGRVRRVEILDVR